MEHQKLAEKEKGLHSHGFARKIKGEVDGKRENSERG